MDIETLSGLKALWTETLGDPRVCIAILDGPINRSHPSLIGSNLFEINTLASNEPSQGPALQHGTHVTSIIFLANTMAPSKVLPRIAEV